ncbi:hypothetical protein PUN28_009924 [Cardiocondyla obscurior]|uniref:Uncharacterized protein n=1 Tax=Cardiocondyla obscurior TaxID=286306 RepID=A0AAW2FKZ8_9HYME
MYSAFYHKYVGAFRTFSILSITRAGRIDETSIDYRDNVVYTNVIRRIPARRNTHSRPANERDSRPVVNSAIADTLGAGISTRLRCTGTAGRARTYSRRFLPDIGDPRICILQSPVNFSLRNKTLIIVPAGPAYRNSRKYTRCLARAQ